MVTGKVGETMPVREKEEHRSESVYSRERNLSRRVTGGN